MLSDGNPAAAGRLGQYPGSTLWVALDELVQPNGQPLGPGEVLVGHQACLGHGGGHTTWTDRTCDQTVFGPPLNTHCTTLEGPATIHGSVLIHTAAC